MRCANCEQEVQVMAFKGQYLPLPGLPEGVPYCSDNCRKDLLGEPREGNNKAAVSAS